MCYLLLSQLRLLFERAVLAVYPRRRASGSAVTRSASKPRGSDHDRLRRLQRALAALPELERRVFIAHRVEGRSLDSIAGSLELGLADVDQLMVVALAKLARAMSTG